MSLSNPHVELFINSLWPLLKGALEYTIPLAIVTFIIGLILGFLTALARITNIKPLEIIARIYVSAFRGTPLLVQLFIIFFGLGSVGITLSPLVSATIGFSLNVGAYASENIRAAILSIPEGQWEAGSSIGMSYSQTLRRIILPQAMRVAVPPLSNEFISLIKDTSLAALILVTELFRHAKQIASQTYEVLFIYCEAALLYWIICFILSLIQDRVEVRLERHMAK